MPFITELADGLGKVVGALAEGDVQGAIDAFSGSLFRAFGPETGKLFKDISETLLGAFNSIRDALAGIDLGPISEAFGNLFSAVGADAPTMQDVVKTVADAIVVAVQGIVDFINDPLLPAFTEIVNWVTEHWPEIQATIETVMTAISTAIDTAIKTVQEIWDVFAPAFQGDWEQFGRNLREKWDELWDAIKEIDWKKIGEDILKGIATGIEAGAIWAINAIRAVADAIMRTLTGFFEAHSPSLKMENFGADLMKGWARGITGGLGEPVGAMRTASTSVANSVVNSGGNTHNYYGVQADMQYAYTRAVAGSF
jgi:phage-related protein